MNIKVNKCRYSAKSFPPYRFLPGHNLHPTESPQGHSYHKPEPVVEPLTLYNWPQNEEYLYGIDLYNDHYWWESHEAWEGLWKAAPEVLTKEFLQGLIKVSAAFIKWELKTPRGVKTHYMSAMEHFQKVAGEQPVYMGIDLNAHKNRLINCFKRVIDAPVNEWPPWTENYPVIELRKP